MRQEGGGDGAESDGDERDDELLDQMIQTLVQGADMPPREVEGVSEEFCDGMYGVTIYTHSPLLLLEFLTNLYTVLERIPSKSLKPTQSCPICNNPFLDDPYPLVVRLPCHTSHIFDLECVRPWLLLRGTCPLDRTDFGKKEREKEKERLKRLEKKGTEDEEDEDLDGMYG